MLVVGNFDRIVYLKSKFCIHKHYKIIPKAGGSHINDEFIIENLCVYFIVPTPFEGEGTIYSNGFFCSVNFDRSIYSS